MSSPNRGLRLDRHDFFGQLWRWQIGNAILTSFSQALPLVMTWWALTAIGAPKLAGTFIAAFTIGDLVGVSIASIPVKRWGQMITMFLCAALAALSLLTCRLGMAAFFPQNQQLILVVAGMFIHGISVGCRTTVFQAFIAQKAKREVAAKEVQRLVRYSVLVSILGPTLAGIYLSCSKLPIWPPFVIGMVLTAIFLTIPTEREAKNLQKENGVKTILIGARLFMLVRPNWPLLSASLIIKITLFSFFSLLLPAMLAGSSKGRPWVMSVFDDVFSISGFALSSILYRYLSRSRRVGSAASISTSLVGLSFVFFFTVTQAVGGKGLDGAYIILAVGSIAMAVAGAAVVSTEMHVSPRVFLPIPASAQLPYLQFIALFQQLLMVAVTYLFGSFLTRIPPIAMIGFLGALIIGASGWLFLSATRHAIHAVAEGELQGAYEKLHPEWFKT
ncbi:MFS transporter [Paraburkholderia tropica]|uniref:hypothetical protein n=1 Tax=Paraburkholderia tropica TaxID=92647 RepID=UPI002AB65A68|nr:hypothetical protein [Paraburkholderia tropica]